MEKGDPRLLSKLILLTLPSLYDPPVRRGEESQWLGDAKPPGQAGCLARTATGDPDSVVHGPSFWGLSTGRQSTPPNSMRRRASNTPAPGQKWGGPDDGPLSSGRRPRPGRTHLRVHAAELPRPAAAVQQRPRVEAAVVGAVVFRMACGRQRGRFVPVHGVRREEPLHFVGHLGGAQRKAGGGRGRGPAPCRGGLRGLTGPAASECPQRQVDKCRSSGWAAGGANATRAPGTSALGDLCLRLPAGSVGTAALQASAPVSLRASRNAATS